MTSRFVLPLADVGAGLTPSSGAQLFFYETGTTTPKDTYSDSAGTIPNANPVVANSVGVFDDIFISGAYKVVLKNTDGVQQWDADPVASDVSRAELAAAGGAGLVGFESETVDSRLVETLDLNRQPANDVDLIVVYGQSNARGYAYNSAGDIAYVTDKVTVWNGTTEIPLTSYTPSQNDGVSNGSMWKSFGNEYAASGRKAIILNCAKGSQSIADLAKGAANTNYSGLLTWVADAKAHLISESKTLGKVFVVFWQGERDSQLETPPDDYLLELQSLWTDLKTDIAADAFGLVTVGSYTLTTVRQAVGIQKMQRRFARDNDDVFILYDKVQAFGGNGLKYDSVHLNQQGYNLIGQYAAKYLIQSHGLAETEQATQEHFDRFGKINLDGSQDWEYYGGWITKNGGAWLLSASGARAHSGIFSVSVVGNKLRLTIVDDVDYVLSANANLMLGGTVGGELAYNMKVLVDENLWTQTDANGRNYVDLTFVSTLCARVKMATSEIDFNSQSASFNTLVSGVFSTGTCTLTHPFERGLTQAVSRDTTTPIMVGCVGGAGTSTVLKAWNSSGVLTNAELAVTLKDLEVPVDLLPDGIELSINIIATKKNAG